MERNIRIGHCRIDTSAWQLARNIIISGLGGNQTLRLDGDMSGSIPDMCVWERAYIRERDVEKVTNVIGICDY